MEDQKPYILRIPFLRWFKEKLYIQLSPVYLHLFLSIFLLVLTGGCINISLRYEENLVNSWTNKLEQEIRSTTEIPRKKEFDNQITEKSRLKTQLEIITNRCIMYFTIAKTYYRWLFATIISCSLATVIASVCLFYISKEGWEKANNYVINIFVVFSSIAIFGSSLTLIFQYENNAKSNLIILSNYMNLKNKIITELTTSTNSEGKTINLKTIVHETNSQLVDYNNFNIALETKNILTIPQVLEKFNSLKKTP